MVLKFTKMHGLGNDFMVIDGIHQTIQLPPKRIKQLSCRHTGIGFDQCLFIEKSTNPDIDFFYRIFNADGSEVGQCGNGARCIARFIEHYGLSHKKILTVATKTTQLKLTLHPNHHITVDMGTPEFQNTPEIIPGMTTHTLFLGNPHVVLKVSDIKTAPVNTLGPQIETHAFFPNQTNVGFFEVKTKNHIVLRVHERGTGETKACGSGAVAAAAVGHKFYDLDQKICVSLPGGDLIIDWPDIAGPIFMTGPAQFVYEGRLIRD